MTDTQIISTSKSIESLINHCQISFEKHYEHNPDLIAFAPGRINIIGEHTDYSEGVAMPAGINRWVVVGLKARSDKRINAVSGNYNGQLSFNLGESVHLPESWQKFVYGAVDLLNNKYQLQTGFDLFVYGNVPIGSGVSSSAAIEVALVNGINELQQLDISPLDRVYLSQQVEHQYLGVKCGIMDQYASQFSKAQAPMLLDFRVPEHKYVEVDMSDYNWVLVNTMVHRELSGSKYSERVDEMTELKTFYAEHGYNHLREVKTRHLDLIQDETLLRRMRHYISSLDRVKQAEYALQIGAFSALGVLLYDAHYSLSEDYEVSCTELDFLADTAMEIDGCLGSRMMGGGFGGCTINLVETGKLDAFAMKIKDAYQTEFDIKPEINVYSLVDGAGIY